MLSIISKRHADNSTIIDSEIFETKDMGRVNNVCINEEIMHRQERTQWCAESRIDTYINFPLGVSMVMHIEHYLHGTQTLLIIGCINPPTVV